MMDFSWTEGQNNLRETYKAFAQQHIAPYAATNSQRNQFNHEAWTALCQTDFWRLVIPENYGGLGGNWWDFTAALEGLAAGAVDSGFILSVISQAGFIHGLLTLGTTAQRDEIFPAMLNGALTATAIAEPHSGTATGWVKTAAHRNEKGHYVLSGDKFNIAHAGTAKYVLVVGRIPSLGKRDITIFIVDTTKTGYQAGDAQEKLGNRTIPTSWIKMDQVALTDGDILGNPGDGVRTLMSVVTIDRLYYALVTAHLIEPLLERAWTFLSERTSFGAPVISHQHVQKKLTDVAIHCEQTKWSSYGGLWQMLHNDPKASLTGSVAKLTAAKGFEQSCRDLVTLLGSIGYLQDMPSRMLADALGFLWVGGTEEMHRINIFKQMERLRKI